MCHSCQVAYDPEAIRVLHGSNHTPLMGKNGHQFQNRHCYLLLCGDVDGGDNIFNSNFWWTQIFNLTPTQHHWSAPETLMNKQKQCQHLFKKPHRDLKMKSLSRQSLFSLPLLLFVGCRNTSVWSCTLHKRRFLYTNSQMSRGQFSPREVQWIASGH